MSSKKQFQYQLGVLLKHNRDGSYSTQAARRYCLFQVAETLAQQGYKLKHPNQLKQKHIGALVQHWQHHELNAGTIKNRLAHVRWLCEKLGRSNVVLSNDELGVERRVYVTNENKAVDIHNVNVDAITDEHVKVQIHLQRYLGLRREECIKLNPHQADGGDYLYLKGSWCKGGRERAVPIDTPEARYWLEQAKLLAPHQHQSLIPLDRSYKQHQSVYDKQVQKAGIKHAHGLRHAYAQERYQQMTGWAAPVCGGPHRRQLTLEQRTVDKVARLKISLLLGHERPEIVSQYCGI